MAILVTALLFGVALAVFAHAQQPAGEALTLQWERLPPLPDTEGFAGSFAGVSHAALIVAGGANITGPRWADPFHKVWYDSAFVLPRPEGPWQSGFKLPRPCAYGVSVTAGDSLVCIGGGDATAHFTDVFQLQWRDGTLQSTSLPKLPKPCAFCCGALLGGTIYIAGGLETPTGTAAMNNFWALDLAAEGSGWRELGPWPGPARMLAVAGAQAGSLFLLSGTSLSPGPDGKAVRKYLRDAYRYTPGRGWTKLADLPRAAAAAATPAVCLGTSRLLVISGDDGTQVNFQPVAQHPGFPRDALLYDVPTNTWSVVGGVPFSRAVAPTAQWRGGTVIVNGEVRPRVRTPAVWSLREP
jgi:N-acetylneuraminic acid mutarotase